MATAFDYKCFDLVECAQQAIRKHFAYEGPELFGGLEFGGVRWQEQRVDTDRPLDVGARVPASAIDHENESLHIAGTHGLREMLERDVERWDVDGRHQEPLNVARRRPDEAVQIQPLIADMLDGNGPLAAGSPHSSRRWLQSDPGFVLGPDFDTRFGDGGLDIFDERLDFFLKSSCASTSALACLVCGLCNENPAR
jgi:hypothetical protein